MAPPPAAPESLKRAMLFEQGKFEEAAGAFDELAQGAEEQGRLFQAANLTAQEARCYMRLEDLDTAYEKGLKSLDLFKRADRPGAARRLAEAMVKVLRDKGRNAEAEALERELSQMPAPARPGGRRGELPGKWSRLSDGAFVHCPRDSHSSALGVGPARVSRRPCRPAVHVREDGPTYDVPGPVIVTGK
jgi:hypothetical protein